jgi:hypothetical protein
MGKRKKKKKRKKQFQAFQTEFNDVADAVVDRLLNPAEDLSAGFVIEYEIGKLKPMAQMLVRKLPVKLQRAERRHGKAPEDDALLWHGTSSRRAESIMESGFRSKTRRGVFFSSNIMRSVNFAERRGSDEHSEPAIFAAIHDLGTLRHGKEFRHQFDYVFKPGVATRIVKYLLTCHGLYSIGKIVTEANKFRDDLTDIAITQSSGKPGIAYWLNSFLDLDDPDCIAPDHPSVGRIKAWIDEQYESGRMGPIMDEEILNLAREFLPEYLT